MAQRCSQEVFGSRVIKECFVSVKRISAMEVGHVTIWVPFSALSHETFGELPQVTSRFVLTGMGRVDFLMTRQLAIYKVKKLSSFGLSCGFLCFLSIKDC